MFKKRVNSRYQVLSYEDALVKKVDDAENELANIDDEIKKVRDEYGKLIDDDAPLEKLLEVEKKLDDLEDDRAEAAKNYESARNLTVEDLKAEQHYEDWKGSR
jgi:predicted nuclease with TOPRIM domain